MLRTDTKACIAKEVFLYDNRLASTILRAKKRWTEVHPFLFLMRTSLIACRYIQASIFTIATQLELLTADTGVLELAE